MPSGERTSRIEGMPLLRAHVHPDVAEAIKAHAAAQELSIRAMVRAILHEFAEDELGVAVDDEGMFTKYTRQTT